MNKLNCRPRVDNSLFLIGCILFSLSFLYSLSGIFSYFYFASFMNAVFAAAICVLFFLVYLGKISIFIPFIVVAVDVLIDNVSGFIGSNGFFGFLNFAAAVFAVLAVMGVVNFDLKLGIAEKIKSKANDPCIIAAAAFALLGIISVIKCFAFLDFGLSFLYIINKLCYFGGTVLVLYSLETERVLVLEGEVVDEHSYNEAREKAKTEEAANNIKYQKFQTADGEVPMELATQENIVKNVVLGVITLGIYWYIWWYRVCRRVRLIEGREPSCGGELACILLVPFYAIYWFYTRAQRLSDGAKRYGIYIKDSSVLYIVLAIFGLSIVSFILIQTELNTFADKLRLGIKDNIDRYNDPYAQYQRPQEQPKEEVKPENESEKEEVKTEVKEEPEKEETEAQQKQNTDEIIETIKKLSELKEQGILSEEEFAAKKSELLDRM